MFITARQKLNQPIWYMVSPDEKVVLGIFNISVNANEKESVFQCTFKMMALCSSCPVWERVSKISTTSYGSFEIILNPTFSSSFPSLFGFNGA